MANKDKANKTKKEVPKRRERSMITKLQDFVPRRLATFIIWSHTAEDKRLPFDEWSSKNIHGVSYDTCLGWCLREDFQEAEKFYVKSTRTHELMKVYYAMLQKANSGDVNAAKFVESFSSNSEFFNDNMDELSEFMAKVQLPATKKKGDK